MATQLAFGLAFSSFFLLPKFVVTELHGSPSQVGYVGALAVVAAVLVSPLCGKLLDRGTRRPLMFCGCLLSGVGALAFLGVTHVGSYLYAVRAVQGISYTFYFVAAGTLVADLSPAARLGQALGWFGSAGLLMNAVATLLAERIAQNFGWHTVFVCAGVSGTLGSLLVLLVQEPANQPARQPQVTSTPKSLQVTSTPKSLLRRETPDRADPSSLLRRETPDRADPSSLGERLPVLWAAAAGGAAFGVMFTFTQPLALQLGDINISPLFAGYTAAALLVRLAFGNLADRLGRARVAGAALAFYSLVVATTAGLARGWLGVLGLGFGLAHGAFYPSLNALALEGVARKERGSVGAHFNAAFNGGVLLVTFCFGQVAQAYGYRVVFLLVACLSASGCFLLLSQARKSWLARPL
ncbi:MAG TPA: MFS transporter [Polyangiaceae bacterium]|nr:MFS transporter [Polyangiaceae bacterium]